jgi:hypothetical protein
MLAEIKGSGLAATPHLPDEHAGMYVWLVHLAGIAMTSLPEIAASGSWKATTATSDESLTSLLKIAASGSWNDITATSGETLINVPADPDASEFLWVPELSQDRVRSATKEEVAEASISIFLQGVYGLARVGDIPTATDVIFDRIDRLLSDDRLRACNEILKRVEPEKLPSSLRRSFLTITAAAKDKLPARRAFYDKALRLLSQEKDEAKARKLLGRLA